MNPGANTWLVDGLRKLITTMLRYGKDEERDEKPDGGEDEKHRRVPAFPGRGGLTSVQRAGRRGPESGFATSVSSRPGFGDRRIALSPE